MKPCAFGLPDKFQEWRPHQLGTITRIATSEKRFIELNAPTGTGKSVSYVAPMEMLDGEPRGIFVTSTTELQDQLLRDFQVMADIRGQGQYVCHEIDPHSCREGLAGGCAHKRTRHCRWFAARLNMQRSDRVVTNYAAYLVSGQEMGWADYLVLDEFHDALNWVTKMVGMYLSSKYVHGILAEEFPREDATVEEWRTWAIALMGKASTMKTVLKYRATLDPIHMREYVLAVDGALNIERLAGKAEAWCIERGDHGYKFEPIDVSKHAGILWRKTPRIVLSSATASRKTTRAFGIADEEIDRIEIPAQFLRDRFRVWACPPLKRVKDKQVSIRWTRDSGESDIDAIIDRMCEIVEGRLDRRGIIHSVSYPRQEQIAIRLRKRFGSRLMVYAPCKMDHKEWMREFVTGPLNAVFISPAIMTGYDFAGAKARYQIIPKLPWPDSRVKLTRERTKLDRDYGAGICMDSLVQACGRINRSREDYGETFIIDGSMDWFWWKYKTDLAPPWFAPYMRIEYGNAWRNPLVIPIAA
jgi:Rad3-related DNA helicase